MFAKCGYQSVYGTVKSSWERRNGKTIYQKNSKHPRIHNLATVCCFAVYTVFLNVI